MTYITKSVTVTDDIDIEIELSDIRKFIKDANNYEISEILNACKYEIKNNIEDFIDVDEYGIIQKTFNDYYKIQALKEIWDDATIEDIESLVEIFKVRKNKLRNIDKTYIEIFGNEIK